MVVSAVIYKSIILSNGSVAANTVTVYYVVGILAALAGAILGGYKLYQRQKVKWTDEGVTRAKQAQATEDNSEKLEANTNAIVTLSARMETWMSKVDANLNGHEHRIERLERFNNHPRSRQEDLD
jgi:uncharacterized protein HemX